MRFTTVSIQRPEGTTIRTGIQVQIDQASLKVQIEHQQAYNHHSADMFKLHTMGWPATLIRRDDVLIDESFIDEETGQLFKYRVIGRPKNHDLDHQECYLDVPMGT